MANKALIKVPQHCNVKCYHFSGVYLKAACAYFQFWHHFI